MVSKIHPYGGVPHSVKATFAFLAYTHTYSGSKLATAWRNTTLQIPLSHDVLGVGVPQASVHVSHMKMEVLVAQWDVQQEEANGDYSC